MRRRIGKKWRPGDEDEKGIDTRSHMVNWMMRLMQSHVKLTDGLIITMQNGIFPPRRDPSLPHPERQDHLQQPERLRGGDGRPHRQRSGGGGGGTEGRPEDRHPISGQWLLQCLQLQLHQWEHTPTHCFFLLYYSVFFSYIFCFSWERASWTFTAERGPYFTIGRVYSRLIELWAVFITDVGWKVVFLCVVCEIMSHFHHPNTWSESQQARFKSAAMRRGDMIYCVTAQNEPLWKSLILSRRSPLSYSPVKTRTAGWFRISGNHKMPEKLTDAACFYPDFASFHSADALLFSLSCSSPSVRYDLLHY